MEENTKYPLGKTIKVMLKHMTKCNKSIYFYCLLYTLGAAIYQIFAVILPKVMITELSLGSQASSANIIYIVGIFFLCSALFGSIASFFKEYNYPRITELRIDLLRDFSNKIMRFNFKYVEDAKFMEEHEKAAKACNGNGNGIEIVYHILFETPANIITAVAFIIFIGNLNIFILLGLLINIIATFYIGRRVHNYRYSRKKDLSHCQRRIHYYKETTYDFSFGKDIRVYNLRDRVLNNFTKEIDGYINIEKQIANKEYFWGFLGLATLLLSDGLTYGILVSKTMNGLPIADFSMYIVAIASLSIILKTIIEDVTIIYNEGHYAYDFFEFLATDYGEKGGELPAIKGDTLEIEFKNVSFKYPRTDKYIIKNLNFKINKGEKLAIVGINGAGKTTLVKLMIGLYYPDEGEILINNTPIQNFDKQALYTMFSVVFQDVNIMAFSIKENVACTSENIDEKKVMQALDRVGLGEKVKSFDNGLNQIMLKIIDENGIDFSGGERQKLAIARALYKDGNMVIMDEPTAALDALAEAEIYENFSELIQGKTAVYISHRLASTKFCDKIALFDNDGLCEYGNHDELMNLKGKYYDMFTIQGKYYQKEATLNA